MGEGEDFFQEVLPQTPFSQKTFKKGILEKMVVFVRWNGMGFESKLRDFGETNNQRVILSEGRRVTPPKSNFCAMKKVA